MKRRLTIGFLDEDAYDEYHSLLWQGICMSAKKYDMNIIRFGHFMVHLTTVNPFHEEILLEYVNQFRLDGMIFLGWARAVNNMKFKKFFGNLPIVSLGSCIDGIPGVFFNGGKYVREILYHLVEEHGMRKIAYVAPFWPDDRNNIYMDVMNSYRLFDPLLYVSESELKNLSVGERGKKAVDILIDERKVKPDAIVSLYNEETYAIVNALREKGIKVPDEIAVTSYEDGETGKFSSPPFTTVYFPWKELGYHACEAIYRLITRGDIPLRTEVSGKVIYRSSCGCITQSAAIVRTGRAESPGIKFDELGGRDLGRIAANLANNTAFSIEETQDLLSGFKKAFAGGTSKEFLVEFETKLRKIESYSVYDGFERIAAVFRKELLPYFLPYAEDEPDKLVWADDLFYQMQVILQHKLTNVLFYEDIKYNQIKFTLKEVGQILITNFNLDSFRDSLETNLPRVGVRGCYIYLFNTSENIRDNYSMFRDYRLVFEFCNGNCVKHHNHPGKNQTLSFEDVLFKEDRAYFMLSHLLYVGDDFIGFVLFDPAQTDIRIYHSLGMQISTALNGIILFEKLDNGYRRLMKQAHMKGMADTTGILHNIANIINTVGVTTQSLDSLLDDSVVNDFKMANEMLESKYYDLDGFIMNDPKGKMLMQYYASLGESFEKYRDRLRTNIEKLTNKIKLIEEIINEQHSYAGIKTNLECLDIVPVIEDALKMCVPSLEQHGIKVVKKFEKSEKAMAQRTKLYHVLTNVFKNAVESMENVEYGKRVLTISILREPGNVFIRISDTGVGIEEGKLQSIFAYGFTTKKGGHGFGLHSCANYMTEMKGRIWAEKSENGPGATFILQLKAPAAI